jgi:hypothetical protein
VVEGARLEIAYSVKAGSWVRIPPTPPFFMLAPTPEEIARRDQVYSRLLQAIQANETIRLPQFDRASESGSAPVALISIANQKNPFGGSVGPYHYQFEGEEDLLHVFVVRLDGAAFPVQEAQQVVSFLLPTVPPALIWLKPGQYSHHMYLGHDLILETSQQT